MKPTAVPQSGIPQIGIALWLAVVVAAVSALSGNPDAHHALHLQGLGDQHACLICALLKGGFDAGFFPAEGLGAPLVLSLSPTECADRIAIDRVFLLPPTRGPPFC